MIDVLTKDFSSRNPSLLNPRTGELLQFLRIRYFCLDPDATSSKLIFNRTVTAKGHVGERVKEVIAVGRVFIDATVNPFESSDFLAQIRQDRIA